jgi:spore maturation protein CgeB
MPHRDAVSRRKRRGYRLGYQWGYHYGRCEAAAEAAADHPGKRFDRKILYITSGKGVPYSPLDESIIRWLRTLVGELIVTSPEADPVAAADRSRPDLAIHLDGMLLDVNTIDRIRERGIRTALWLTDDPYYTDATINIVGHYDYIFSIERGGVSFYKELGCPEVHYLPLGCDPSVFRPCRVAFQDRKEICFAGSGFWNRIELIDSLSRFLKHKNLVIAGKWWSRLPHYKRLKSKIRRGEWLSPEATASFYNSSKIALNIHRRYDDSTINNNTRRIPAVSPNPRTFEISGCGVLQLTDVREDLPNFYIPGEEIVTYSSPEELKYKIDYYLRHEEERQQIALRGLIRTLREHTYEHRLVQLLQTVFP